MSKKIDYQIMSIPSYILFDCPYCGYEEMEVSLDEVDFKTGYWGDGGKVRCPHCNKEIELGDYEYE